MSERKVHRRVAVPQEAQPENGGGSCDTENMSLADAIRARNASRRLAESGDVGLGSMFPASIFSKFDLVVFAILLFLLYVVVRSEYNVDLAKEAWEYIKPNYDEGHFDP